MTYGAAIRLEKYQDRPAFGVEKLARFKFVSRSGRIKKSHLSELYVLFQRRLTQYDWQTTDGIS